MKSENVKGLIDVLNGDARNAMHSILGFLELVSEGALNPAQSEYIEACRVAVDRHFRGIEDARVILGLVPEERPVMTHFAPDNLFGQIAEAIGLIARRKGIGLFCNVENSVPPLVSADLERIGHTLLRISEAVVSTIEGGDVRLNFRALTTSHGPSLIFEILTPSNMLSPVLLLALRQDDFEFDSALPGSEVLAMAAARNLATALGCSIETSADSSTGTRIAVTIPVAARSTTAKPSRTGAEQLPPANRALRILVAEDSEDSFKLFKAYLRGEPHVVTRATNGSEAVMRATSETFDLLFMDIRMPVMDGYAATRRIRELETGKDRARIPIVVLSAEDLRAQRRQGALVGCSGHLSKPLRKHELLEAIRVYSVPQSITPLSPVSVSSH
jgi:CheY-like chemotaxis protein